MKVKVKVYDEDLGKWSIVTFKNEVDALNFCMTLFKSFEVHSLCISNDKKEDENKE